jgi:hypothetical protein
MPIMLDPNLARHATPLQRQALEALDTHGTNQAAAEALGIGLAALKDRLHAVRVKAARAGWSPETQDTRPVSPAHYVKGSSKLYRRGEEEPLLVWVRTNARDEDRLQAFREAVELMVQDFAGAAPAVPGPAHVDADLMTVIPLGDPHIGQLSWGLETKGPDYDLQLAEAELFGCVDRLVAQSPQAGRCLILSVGDLFHADDSTNRTPAHHNILDVDSRYPKIAAVGLRLLRRMIERAAERHARVDAWLLPGNHDPHLSIMIALALAAIYERDDRVQVSIDPGAIQVLEFGRTLVAATHGHGVKPAKLPGVVSAEWPELWGRTRYRYGYTGHVHHDSVQELPGMLVETVRTTAPKDAYAASKGYSSGRDMKCDILHRTRGRIGRIIQAPEHL